MSITDNFIRRGLKVVKEVTDERFSMVDDGGVEIETGEFLYGFLRRLKPNRVLETGTYSGISALYMAKALQDNGFGHLTTIEYDPFQIERAQKLWQKMGVEDCITAIKSDSRQYQPDVDGNSQFLWLDTEPSIRFQELVRFYPYLDEGGYIFIHDTPRNLTQGNVNPDHPEFKSWPFGEVPQEMREFLETRKLMPFYFGGGRGMMGLYKTHKDDYI